MTAKKPLVRAAVRGLEEVQLASSDLSDGPFYPQPAPTITKEATGFASPVDVIVTYDPTSRKITLSGTTTAYWQGVPVVLNTDVAHDPTTGQWFLFYNGVDCVWQMTTPWSFDMLQIASVYYSAGNKFALRECHGLMDWRAHEILHRAVGTILSSGGDLGSITLNSTTPGQRRPSLSSTTILDEDCPSVLPLLAAGTYTQFYLTSANTPVFTPASAEIVPVLAANPYYNLFATPNWTQVLMANNSYMCVWLLALPSTASAGSQGYRYLWVQGQSNGSLASQQALSANSLNLSSLLGYATEFVPIAKIIIRFQSSDWSITSYEKITGSKAQSIAVPGGAYLSSVTANAPLSGSGTVGDPLLMAAATDAVAGYLSSSDHATFSSKQAAYAILSALGVLANAAGYLHNDGAGSLSYSTPGGAGVVRTTATVSSGSLAAGATANVALTLSKSTAILSIGADYPAWVRLYSSDAARTADAGRNIVTDPASGSGIFAESILIDGALTVKQSPVEVFVNDNSPVDTNCYVAITNKDSVTRTITLTVIHLPMET